MQSPWKHVLMGSSLVSTFLVFCVAGFLHQFYSALHVGAAAFSLLPLKVPSITVDVPLTWIHCLCPMVMSHLERAACLCFVNRGLDVLCPCAELILLQQSVPRIKTNQCDVF